MAGKKIRKERIIDILKVAQFLETNPNTHLREIARRLKMNPSVVHRTLNDLENFIITRSINEEIGGTNLPNLPVVVRLKEGITMEGIRRFLRIKSKLSELK